MIGTQKEIERLTKAVERYGARLAKKEATANKLNCNWTEAQWWEHRDTNDYTINQYSAYMELSLAQGYYNEAVEKLAKANARREVEVQEEAKKAEQDAEETRIARIEESWTREDWEKWVEEFKAECLKDGVKIDEVRSYRVTGTTKNGKPFTMDKNNGHTKRSRYCFTLTVNGATVFTSGEFSTGYRYIKK